MHSQLKSQKDNSTSDHATQSSVDAFANYQNTLCTWQVDQPIWIFDCELPEIVAQACPSGADIAFKVWHLFRLFKWRDPTLPRRSGSRGVNWPFIMPSILVPSLPLWIYDGTKKRAYPVSFDSPEAKIQKPEARSVWHQANNLRAVVRYLENTLQCSLFPRYKKTGASSLIRLGYHTRLVGGISARPEFPHANKLMENLSNYSSLAAQTYPLNVRIELPLISPLETVCAAPYASMSFSESQKLYQRVKKCIRNKHDLASLSFAQ